MGRLNLSVAKQKGNVSAACRAMGVDRSTYYRLKQRVDRWGALGAVKHSIILTTGELYNDLGGDYFARRDPEKTTKRLLAQLQRLGHTVTLDTA